MLTSGQSILTKGRIADMSPSRRRLDSANPNLIHTSLGPLESDSQTASRSVQPFLRIHRRFHILFSGADNSQKLPLLLGDRDPHLTYGSLGPSESPTQTSFRSVKLFFAGLVFISQNQRLHQLYFCMHIFVFITDNVIIYSL